VTRLPSTAGSQPPRKFASHCWLEPVKDFIKCIEQHVRDFARNRSDEDDRQGGGMTFDTPIWICAYGNNQWDLSDITVDPRESSFTKAMKVAEGRTITILDSDGMVFTRVWCVFELDLTLTDSQGSKKGVWSVYTPHKHTAINPWNNRNIEMREAVGIVSGGAPCDNGATSYTTAREKAFPYEVIAKSLTIKVEKAEATKEADRIHILNSIIGLSGDDLNNPPPEEHETFTTLNESLKSVFAASQASLQGAAKDEDSEWMAMLEALSKGTKTIEMTFDFGSEGGFEGLTTTRASQLISHLPLTTDYLWIKNAEFGAEFIESLSQRVTIFENLRTLWIYDTLVGGDEDGVQDAGVCLANELATNTTITSISLYSTNLIVSDNVAQWGDALMKNKTLTRLRLRGVGSDIVDELKAKTKGRTPDLEFLFGNF